MTADLDELDSHLLHQPHRLDANLRRRVDKAIVDHHRYHERKRKERAASRGSSQSR